MLCVMDVVIWQPWTWHSKHSDPSKLWNLTVHCGKLLKDNIVSIFFILNKSHEITKTDNELILLATIICVAYSSVP